MKSKALPRRKTRDELLLAVKNDWEQRCNRVELERQRSRQFQERQMAARRIAAAEARPVFIGSLNLLCGIWIHYSMPKVSLRRGKCLFRSLMFCRFVGDNRAAAAQSPREVLGEIAD